MSLLLVGALKQYCQMVSKVTESNKKAAVGSIGRCSGKMCLI